MYKEALFEQLGFDKTAGIADYLFRDIGDRYAKQGRTDKPGFLGHVGDFFRAGTLGSPLTLKDEISKRMNTQGVLKGLGSHIKDFYWHSMPEDMRNPNAMAKWFKDNHMTYHPTYQKLRGPLMKERFGRLASNAVSLGLPAYDFYHALRNGDPTQRRGDIASGITGLALAPFTARLGIPGTVLQGVGQNLVRHLVSPSETAQNYAQPFDPANHLRLTARGMAAGAPVDVPQPS